MLRFLLGGNASTREEHSATTFPAVLGKLRELLFWRPFRGSFWKSSSFASTKISQVLDIINLGFV